MRIIIHVARCLVAVLVFVSLFMIQDARAQSSGDSCESCHNSIVQKRRAGGSPHNDVDCTDCHAEVPNQHAQTRDAGPVTVCTDCHDDIFTASDQSIHIERNKAGDPAPESCLSCHTDIHGTPRKVDCEMCHDDVAAALVGSKHWEPDPDGSAHRVSCTDCHRDVHDIMPSSERESSLNRRNVYRICAQCHDDADKPAANPITGDVFVPVSSYLSSIHGSKLDKVPGVASCTDCHGHHGFKRIMNPNSTLSREHIIDTCGKCHQGKRDEFWTGTHGHLLLKENESVANMSEAERVAFERDHPLDQRPPVCTSCHTSHSIQPAGHMGEPDAVQHLCSQCHSKEVDLIRESVHGATQKRPGIKCSDCHSDYHANKDIRSGDSAVSKRNVADVCSKCHSKPEKVETTGDIFDPVASYKASVHGKGLYQSGLYFSAGCIDCHGSHDIFQLGDDRSTLHHRNLTDTCGNPNCHFGIHELFLEGIHGDLYRAEKKKYESLPKVARATYEFKGPECIDCHLSHSISRTDKPEFYVEAARQCGGCHPLAMETYMRSYHGKAALLGSADVAKCYDCHGSHLNKVPYGKDRDLDEEAVLVICKRCHKKATRQMVSYINHLEIRERAAASDDEFLSPLDTEKRKGLKVLRFFRFMMEALLLSVFLFFGVHTLLWFFRGMVERIRHPEDIPLSEKMTYYRRIDGFHRVTHAFVIVSFLGLALTGMPIKYPDHPRSRAVFDALDMLFHGNGGQVARLFHRIFAVITFCYLTLHVAYLCAQLLRGQHGATMKHFRSPPVDLHIPLEARTVGWYARWIIWLIPIFVAYVPVNLYLQARHLLSSKQVMKDRIRSMFGPNSMIPRPKDLRDIWHNFKWFLWLGPRPRWDRWTYYEKFDYWAVFWGVAIIGVSGLCMWFKEFFTSTIGMPGWMINVAMEIHSHEALLAMGFIFSIHFFNGHLRPGKFPMDTVIFSGVVNRHELEHERPEEFERLLQSGRLEQEQVSPPPIWLRVVGPLFGIAALTIGFLLIIWIFQMEVGKLIGLG